MEKKEQLSVGVPNNLVVIKPEPKSRQLSFKTLLDRFYLMNAAAPIVEPKTGGQSQQLH